MRRRSDTPIKPEKQKDQISMLWDAVYNHLPCQIHWQDKKINFILAFVSLILGLLTFLAIAFMVGQ